ncbi:hypothetical protein PTKIN_Ptkin11bG0157000 [Pterospermum kingtungense]
MLKMDIPFISMMAMAILVMLLESSWDCDLKSKALNLILERQIVQFGGLIQALNHMAIKREMQLQN